MPNPPIIGQVQIENTTTQFPTITINGDTGSIGLGGKSGGFVAVGQPEPAYNGQITLENINGSKTAILDSGALGGSLTINNGKGQQNAYLGTPGFNLGGNGAQGAIRLYPSTSPFGPQTETITVGTNNVDAWMTVGGNAVAGQIGVFPASSGALTFVQPGTPAFNSANIHLRASDSTIRAGGGGHEGRLLLLDKDAGKSRISLEGSLGYAGLGGNGQFGQLGLFPAAATDIQDPKQSTIFMNGSNGDVKVTGNIAVSGDITLANADCAEDFDVATSEELHPGTVMVINQEGALRASRDAYDTKVAGVLSGAGDYKPGIVLDKQQSPNRRMPVALVGKVFCKADAQYSAIAVGDLLTTSPTPGCAMKATDPYKAFGAVIGKALKPLKEGQGLIPILIALQ
jgi:hypothetical protein